MKKEAAAAPFLYQPRVLLLRWRKESFFSKPELTMYPLDSSEVFLSDREAQDYIPIHLNRLLREKVLDADKLFAKDGKTLNEDYVKTAIVTLTVTKLELDIDQ